MKKKLAILCLLLILLFNFPVFAIKSNDALDITKQVSINGELDFPKITDNDMSTFCNIEKTTKIVVTSKKGFYGVNFIFDVPPKKWRIIQENNDEIPCGKNGFLHEYVKFDNQQKKITIEFECAKLSEIQFFTDGKLPSNVQIWNPPHYNSDLLLVCDKAGDEFNLFGGLIPLLEKDEKIQVAYMQELFDKSNSKLQHDLLNSLWNSGLTTYPSFFESKKSDEKEDDILQYQVEIIRRFKSNVIVLPDENSPNFGSFKKALTAAKKPEEFQLSALEYGVYSPEKVYNVSTKNDDNLTKLDFSSSINIAQKSLDFYGFKNKIVTEKTNSYNLLYTSVGKDGNKNDLFENIILDKTENIQLPVENETTNPTQENIIKEKENSKKNKRSLIGNSLIICGILIMIFSVSHKNRRKKRNLASPPLTHNSMRDKYIQ